MPTVTSMATSDATAAMRVRAEQALDRGGAAASQSAGELAGRFAAMLEQLNGVTDAANGGGDLESTSRVGPVTTEHRVSLGAVSIFAQQAEGAGVTAAGGTPSDPAAGAAQVVASTVSSGRPHDVRWLTTLFTQSGAAGAGG